MTICEKTEQFVCISCVVEVRYSFLSNLSKALRRKGINDVVIDVDSDDLLSKDSQAKLEKARVSVMVLPGNCDLSKVWLDKFVKVLECPRNKDQVVVPVLYGDSPLQSEWLSALDLGGLSPIHQSRKECSDAKLVEEIVRDVYDKLFYMGRIGINAKLLEIENMVCKQPLDDIRCVGIWGMPGIGKTTLAKALFDQISGEFDAYCFIKDYDKVIHENGLYRLLEENFLKEKPGASGDITKFSLLKNKLYNKRVLVVLDDVRNPLVAEPFLGGFDWFGPESLIIITSRDKQVLRLCEVNQIYEVQGLNEKEARQLFSLCARNYMEEQNLEELSMKVIKYANGHPLALKIYGRELKCKRKLSEMETTFLKLKQRPPFRIVDAFKSSYDTLSDSEKNIFLDIACFFQGDNVDYVMQLLEGCGFFPRVGIDVLVEKSLVTMSGNCVWMHNLIQDVGREIINGETVQIERRSRLWEPWSVKYLLEDNGEKENGEPKTTFKHSQGTKEIEGMFLDTSNLSFDVKPTAFDNMLNLRLLKIYCSNPKNHPVINFPKGSLHSLPNELRLLHWENYSLQSLPQSFDPSHLVEINMPYSQLQKLWDGTENLEMLRTIRLCHSQQLVDIGDLLKAQNLEVIDLQGCTRLQSFPATGKLLHLRGVNLSGCTEVKSFPEIPPNIETLHLQGTGIEKLLIPKPNGGELVSLSALKGLPDALKLERLTSLEKSSLSSQVLGKLICLNLKDCSRLQSLPNMVNLKLLKVLDISGCSELKTIKGFPPNLKQLYIAGTAVRKVPQLPQSLQLLSAHGCVSLKSIHFDFEKLPVHYTFSNCFDLSPQMVNVFLVKALSNAEHIPREHQQELKESPAFSFCAPSHAKNISTLDLKPGSSVMTRLIPSWRNMLVGFAMLVEVAFSEDYCDATGFGIRCVCKWKNKEGHSHRIERNLHCWALGKAVQKDHMFVFFDVNMRPSRNDPNIWADLVVFEFFPVSKQTKPLDDCCTVTRCGVRVITAANCNTSLENISPVLSLDPMEFSGYENEEVLRDSYDDLQEMDKVLFLYIACLFNDEDVDFVAPLIANIIDMDVSSGLKVLAGRSLISVSSNGEIVMHFLLRQMGKELLRTKPMLPDVLKPKRKVDHVVPSDLWDSENYNLQKLWEGIKPRKNLRWMDLGFSRDLKELPDLSTAINLEELCLEECSSLVELPSSIGKLTNLQILNLRECSSLVKIPSSIENATNLQILDLSYCSNLVELPSIGNTTKLERLNLNNCSSLVKLPSYINATNLQKLFLRNCSRVVELPAIENATNMKELILYNCSSLLELPPSIGTATNLKKLEISGCSSLMKIPDSIGDMTNLKEINLSNCSSLVELPSSIGNLQKLCELTMCGCSKLEALPTNINLKSLGTLDLTDCSQLKSFPEISTNIWYLNLIGTAIKEVPLSIMSWSRLFGFHMSYFESLKEFPHAFDIITELCLVSEDIEEVPPWVKGMSRLIGLRLNNCNNLVSLPQLSDSLYYIVADNCKSLERLDCSFNNPDIRLSFPKCFKLNQEARDLIMHTSDYAILPGTQVPACFNHRATAGGSLKIKLNESPLPTSLRFKACIMLVKGKEETSDDMTGMFVDIDFMDKQKDLKVRRTPSRHYINRLLTKHIYTFEVKAEEVTSTELVFEFKPYDSKWKIGECGLLQILELPSC